MDAIATQRIYEVKESVYFAKSFQTNDVKKDTDCILEVKFNDKGQENVCDLLDNFEFVISRHSKYLKRLYYFDVINYL